MQERKINGLAALDELKAIAEEKDKASDLAKSIGLSERAFGVYWVLSKEPALAGVKVDIQRLAVGVEVAVDQYPHWRENADEERRLRSGLYRPLLDLPAEPRKEIIEKIMNVLEKI